VPDSDTSRSADDLARFRRPIDDDEVRLEQPRLEPLTAVQETEAVERLAALFAAAGSRRAEGSPLPEAA
jgi:hypothetical protein